MRCWHPLLCVWLTCVLSCSQREPPPTPSLEVDAEMVVRSTSPGSTCGLFGTFHVPRQQEQRIRRDQFKTVATNLLGGDVLAMHANVTGTNPWACEAECTLRQSGKPNSSTTKTPPLPKEPAPSCPPSSREITCVLYVQP